MLHWKVLHLRELFHYYIFNLGLPLSYVFIKLCLLARIGMWQLTLHLKVALVDNVDAFNSVALTEDVLVAHEPRQLKAP